MRAASDGIDVEQGTLTAEIAGCAVTLTAEPVPPRIWTAMVRAARGNPPLEDAIEGRRQSVHLEHLMTVDWSEPLVPRAFELGRACTCDDADRVRAHRRRRVCRSRVAIDADPSLLLTLARLRARGARSRPRRRTTRRSRRRRHSATRPTSAPGVAARCPSAPPLRPLPVGAVLKRLGPSGLQLRGDDLALVLQRAYDSFAAAAE